MRGVKVQGNEVRTARLQRALTQAELARLAGLDVKTVRKAEQGNRIDLAPLTRLATALDCAVGQLIVPEPVDAEMEDRRRASVIAWALAFDRHDSEALLRLYHDDAILRIAGGSNIPFAGEFRGKAAIRQAHESAWAGPKQEPTDVDNMSLHISDTAVTLSEEKGIYLPNGELFRFPCLQIFIFFDDLIREHEVQFDTLDFVQKMSGAT